MSQFDELKELINIRFQNNRLYLYRKDVIFIGDGYSSTMDTYRRMLTIIGVLEETPQKGVYKIINKVDESLTSNQLRKQAYGNRI